MAPILKPFLTVLIYLYSISSFAANDSISIMNFWVSLRYSHCDDSFAMIGERKNQTQLNYSAQHGACKEVDLTNPRNEDTLKCFKETEATLKHWLQSIDKDYGCKISPGYKAYLDGDRSLLLVKPIVYEEPILPADQICKPAERTPFKFFIDGHMKTCTKKFECEKKFTFGKKTLEKGTYSLRCNSQAKSQADCDEITLVNCKGKEETYAEWNFFGQQKESKVVVPSKVNQ